MTDKPAPPQSPGLREALETAAARFNMMAGVGLVNGADPKVGYRECMEALAASVAGEGFTTAKLNAVFGKDWGPYGPSASVAGEANPIAWRWKIRLNQAWCYDDRKPYSYPDAQPLYAAPSPALDPGTVEALEQRWRTEARKHFEASQDDDCQAGTEEWCLHRESNRVYSRCANDLAALLASPAPGNAEQSALQDRACK